VYRYEREIVAAEVELAHDTSKLLDDLWMDLGEITPC